MRSLVLTTRSAVLALVLSGLVVLLAFPLHQLVAQRGQIAALERQRDAQEASVTALAAQEQELQTPAYIEMQARTRLQYVLPGEQAFIVLDPSTAPTAPVTAPRVAPVGDDDRPWWNKLVTSADIAGAAPVVADAPTVPTVTVSPRPIPSMSTLPTPGPPPSPSAAAAAATKTTTAAPAAAPKTSAAAPASTRASVSPTPSPTR